MTNGICPYFIPPYIRYMCWTITFQNMSGGGERPNWEYCTVFRRLHSRKLKPTHSRKWREKKKERRQRDRRERYVFLVVHHHCRYPFSDYMYVCIHFNDNLHRDYYDYYYCCCYYHYIVIFIIIIWCVLFITVRFAYLLDSILSIG